MFMESLNSEFDPLAILNPVAKDRRMKLIKRMERMRILFLSRLII